MSAIARVIDTLKRFGLVRKPRERIKFASSISDGLTERTVVKIITFLSWP